MPAFILKNSRVGIKRNNGVDCRINLFWLMGEFFDKPLKSTMNKIIKMVDENRFGNATNPH